MGRHAVNDARPLFWKFLADDKGATAIEYGLLAAGSAVGGARHQPEHDILQRFDRAQLAALFVGTAVLGVNHRSTSLRHDRGSVGVGRTMGRLPASERPPATLPRG